MNVHLDNYKRLFSIHKKNGEWKEVEREANGIKARLLPGTFPILPGRSFGILFGLCRVLVQTTKLLSVSPFTWLELSLFL